MKKTELAILAIPAGIMTVAQIGFHKLKEYYAFHFGEQVYGVVGGCPVDYDLEMEKYNDGDISLEELGVAQKRSSNRLVDLLEGKGGYFEKTGETIEIYGHDNMRDERYNFGDLIEIYRSPRTKKVLDIFVCPDNLREIKDNVPPVN